MLGDSILVMIAMVLLSLGVQSMLQESSRKNSVEISKSTTLIVAGVFIMFYWNTIVP